MNNAELIVKLLEAAGVRWVFGIPSGPVLPLIEALRPSSIRYVLTANETSAGFMAHTVGALTGVPGVCVSTLGPGATNLATGVGAAWLDRAPVIAITCNVETAWLERRVQMRIDHHALFAPLTKASLPLRRDRVAERLGQALALSRAEPPGPVHLDLPEDVSLAPASETAAPPDAAETPAGALPPIGPEVLAALAAALQRSQRPLLVGGLALTRTKRRQHLLEFIERQHLPFALTLHAKGFLPESHPNYVGVIGRARRSDVAAFVRQADLIIGMGYDPIEINYEEWVGAIPVMHLSTETADVAAPVRTLLNAGGDLEAAWPALAALPPQQHAWTAGEFAAHRRALERALRPARPVSQGLAPHDVLDALRARLPADAILTYDVGAHTHQIATQWRTDEPHTCFSTNGWSSMGFGLPATYAAKLVHPNRVVVGVVGDGCFQMTVGEVSVAKRLGLAAPVVVLNDGWLGLLKVKQERKGYGLSGVDIGEPAVPPPDYFGVPCRAVHTADELTAALDWALALDGPSIIEALVDVAPYSTTVYD